MHRTPFSGRAPPGPAGGAYRAVIDPGLGDEFGPQGTGEEWKREKGIGWEGERRVKGRRAKEAHCPQIYSYRTLHGQAMNQKVETKFLRRGVTTALYLPQWGNPFTHPTPHTPSFYALHYAFRVTPSHFNSCHSAR